MTQRGVTYQDIELRARGLKDEFPGLSFQQRYAMAAIELQPYRNDDAAFIGIDAAGRPVYENGKESREPGHRVAHTKAGDPTDVSYPVQRVALRTRG